MASEMVPPLRRFGHIAGDPDGMTVRPTLNPAPFVPQAANGGISVHLARMFTTSALIAEGEPGDDLNLPTWHPAAVHGEASADTC